MRLKKNTKVVTFKESYHGETYVGFAEDKTEKDIFNSFLTWISYYSTTFASYCGWDKTFNAQIKADFQESLTLKGSSKFIEYQSEEFGIQVTACFYKEDKDNLPTNLNRGHCSASITLTLEVDVPSLHDGNILHEDLAHLTYSMSITDLKDVRFLID